MATNDAASLLREAAEAVEAVVLSQCEMDLIELMALHIKGRCSGFNGDRCRTAKLLMRRLDDA